MAKSWLGETVSGRYQIESMLGQGGMSAVYRAYDPNLRRVVAVKMIHPHLSDNPNFIERFKEEAAAVARLRHPNIVQVHDFNSDGDTYYMVLEYLAGETLQARLKRLNASHRYLPLDETLWIGRQICDAAGYAHLHGLIHRDIKPANVMLDVNGQAILMDFGIVKIIGGDYHTTTGATVGTALYMSPEQIRSERVDERTDIYSIGVMLYEMASGRPPYQADSAMTLMMMVLNDPLPDLRVIRPDIPAGLQLVIYKALAKNRKDRYQSASELAADLVRLQGELAAPAEQATEADAGATIIGFTNGQEAAITGRNTAAPEPISSAGIAAQPEASMAPVVVAQPSAAPLPIEVIEPAIAETPQGSGRKRSRRSMAVIAAAAVLVVILAGLAAVWVARQPPEPELAPIQRPTVPLSVANVPVAVSLGRWDLSASTDDMDFSPDGALLSFANYRDWVRLTQYKFYASLIQVDAGELRFIQRDHPSYVYAVDFSPDGEVFATAGEEAGINLWQTGDGSPVGQIASEDGGYTDVDFSPNGLLLATSSWDGKIRLWQVSNGLLLRTMEGHDNSTLDVEFSPDGRLLASASDDNTIILWQVSDGSLLHTLQGHTASVYRMAFSPDGTLLASGSDDHYAALWQVSDGSLLRMLPGHTEAVTDVAFSPDGSLLATSSYDTYLKLWQVSDFSLLRDLRELEDGIRSVEFSPDGALLAAASGSGWVQFWGISEAIPAAP